jgi:hypothetical protein
VEGERRLAVSSLSIHTHHLCSFSTAIQRFGIGALGVATRLDLGRTAAQEAHEEERETATHSSTFVASSPFLASSSFSHST